MLRRSRCRFSGMGNSDAVFTPGVVLPKRFLLVRHGQSMGNIDDTEYTRTPDWRIPLTPKGVDQAAACGAKICSIIKDEPVALYYSPYVRARQTMDGVRVALNAHSTRIISEREDARLREQDMGNLQRSVEDMDRNWKMRSDFGRLLFRFPSGESGADAGDRAASFIESFFRERQISTFPDDTNAILVTHGLLIRLFIYRWFHLTVELFEQIKNPDNCAVIVMERYVQRGTGRRRMRLSLEDHSVLGIPQGIELVSRYRQSAPPLTATVQTPLHVLHGRPQHSTHPDDD